LDDTAFASGTIINCKTAYYRMGFDQNNFFSGNVRPRPSRSSWHKRKHTHVRFENISLWMVRVIMVTQLNLLSVTIPKKKSSEAPAPCV